MTKQRMIGWIALLVPIVLAIGYWWGSGVGVPDGVIDGFAIMGTILAVVVWLLLACMAISGDFDDG